MINIYNPIAKTTTNKTSKAKLQTQKMPQSQGVVEQRRWYLSSACKLLKFTERALKPLMSSHVDMKTGVQSWRHKPHNNWACGLMGKSGGGCQLSGSGRLTVLHPFAVVFSFIYIYIISFVDFLIFWLDATTASVQRPLKKSHILGTV